MLILSLFFFVTKSIQGCIFENTQLCNNLQEIENEPSILSLLQNLLTPQSTLVDVIYSIIVTQDEMKKRKELSQNMLIDQEFHFELFEQNLLNQRRRNYIQEQLLRQKLEKFFIPRRNCFEQIMYHLDNLSPLINNILNDNRKLYISIRDQLQYRSACYSLLGGINDSEIDGFSREEVEEYNAEDRFQGIDWEDIFREIIKMDITINNSQSDIKKSYEKVYNYFEPLFESSKSIVINQIHQLGYQQVYESMLQEKREKDKFFRQQLQFNRDAMQQESDNDKEMRELYEYEWKILEAKIQILFNIEEIRLLRTDLSISQTLMKENWQCKEQKWQVVSIQNNWKNKNQKQEIMIKLRNEENLEQIEKNEKRRCMKKQCMKNLKSRTISENQSKPRPFLQ